MNAVDMFLSYVSLAKRAELSGDLLLARKCRMLANSYRGVRYAW
jgi:hypothetical protein